ncbi:MAG: DNA polymerase III subunit chi [Alphaproteobacteria bacterium]|nr:DNA polymerase III subunit chi [Alphaproteobacteria bacterium]
MAEVLFYHLERARLETVLPELLEKSLQRGWKAVVRAGAAETVAWLDEKLWTFRDDSFLPHSADPDPKTAARQPIWITTGADRPNTAEILFVVDGARLDMGEIPDFARCVLIFDGADEAAIGAARALWKDIRGAGHAATYWRQGDAGRWEKQA